VIPFCRRTSKGRFSCSSGLGRGDQLPDVGGSWHDALILDPIEEQCGDHLAFRRFEIALNDLDPDELLQVGMHQSELGILPRFCRDQTLSQNNALSQRCSDGGHAKVC